MKRCIDCNQILPESEFYVGKTAINRCPDCRRARNRELAKIRKVNGPSRILNRVFTDPDTGMKMKKCGECGETQPIANFGKQGVTYRKTCRPCTRMVQARQYSENPEYFREASRRWAKKNPDKVRSNYQSWNDNGGREWRAEYQRRPDVAERRREQERNHYWAMSPEERSAYNRREYESYDIRSYAMAYRSLADSRPRTDGEPVIAPEDIIRVADVIERDGMTCYLCSENLTADEVTIDHIVPISRGGSHDIDNLKVACGPCNSRKGAKLLDELDWIHMP